jgi:hypothetical protein
MSTVCLKVIGVGGNTVRFILSVQEIAEPWGQFMGYEPPRAHVATTPASAPGLC